VLLLVSGSGVLEAEFVENEVNVIPITYPFATSHIWWPINHAEEFNIKFDFRSSRPGAVLAYSDVTTSAGNGFWEVSVSIQGSWFLGQACWRRSSSRTK